MEQHDAIAIADKEIAQTVSSSECTIPFDQLADGMRSYRIMVIGGNVAVVQRVSRYCLEQGAEVLPYYGLPTDEEISVFAPHLFVLCLPVANDFRQQITQPYILWSEQPMNTDIALVYTLTELQVRLQEVLHA